MLSSKARYRSNKSFQIPEIYPIGVEWVCLASLFQGVFGSFTSVLTGVLAYIGSITTREERTARISVLMSMSFVAGTVGPFVSGFLATHTSHLAVFVSIAVCHLANVFYILVFIAESRTEKRPLTCGNVFSLEHFKTSFRTCFIERTPVEKRNVIILLVSAMFVMVVTAGLNNTMTIFPV